MLYSKGGIDLRHFAERRLGGTVFEVHWAFADIQLKHDLRGAGLLFVFVTLVFVTPAAQGKCRTQRGMTGERQLFLNSKDTHANATLPFDGWIARQDERGLREIHFLGERLHLGISQSAAVEKYSQRIALEWTRGKNVPLHHRQTSWRRVHELFPGRKIYGTDAKTYRCCPLLRPCRKTRFTAALLAASRLTGLRRPSILVACFVPPTLAACVVVRVRRRVGREQARFLPTHPAHGWVSFSSENAFGLEAFCPAKALNPSNLIGF